MSDYLANLAIRNAGALAQDALIQPRLPALYESTPPVVGRVGQGPFHAQPDQQPLQPAPTLQPSPPQTLPDRPADRLPPLPLPEGNPVGIGAARNSSRPLSLVAIPQEYPPEAQPVASQLSEGRNVAEVLSLPRKTVQPVTASIAPAGRGPAGLEGNAQTGNPRRSAGETPRQTYGLRLAGAGNGERADVLAVAAGQDQRSTKLGTAIPLSGEGEMGPEPITASQAIPTETTSLSFLGETVAQLPLREQNQAQPPLQVRSQVPDLPPLPARQQRRGERSGAPPVEVGQPPAIRVSIGRVEVRAILPAAPAEKASLHPPRLSLDEYLQQHNEAKQ
jgi:hypothetical protein